MAQHVASPPAPWLDEVVRRRYRTADRQGLVEEREQPALADAAADYATRPDEPPVRIGDRAPQWREWRKQQRN